MIEIPNYGQEDAGFLLEERQVIREWVCVVSNVQVEEEGEAEWSPEQLCQGELKPHSTT